MYSLRYFADRLSKRKMKKKLSDLKLQTQKVLNQDLETLSPISDEISCKLDVAVLNQLGPLFSIGSICVELSYQIIA